MNSPMLPSAMLPKVSDATMLLTFIDCFWSMIAFALPSRSVETVNAASFTVSPVASDFSSALVKFTSVVAVAPAVTLRLTVAVV